MKAKKTMKYLLLSILFLFSVSSCTLVYFDKPVPPFGKEIKEFPDLFKGSFHLAGDTLSFGENSLTLSKDWFREISNNPEIDIDLSGLIYKLDGNILVVNIPNENDKGEINYLIALLEIDDDELIIRAPFSDKDYGFHYDKPLILVGGIKIIYDKEKGKVDRYILSPNAQDWSTLKEVISMTKTKILKRVGT